MELQIFETDITHDREYFFAFCFFVGCHHGQITVSVFPVFGLLAAFTHRATGDATQDTRLYAQTFSSSLDNPSQTQSQPKYPVVG